jgi:hypothetical protein
MAFGMIRERMSEGGDDRKVIAKGIVGIGGASSLFAALLPSTGIAAVGLTGSSDVVMPESAGRSTLRRQFRGVM